MPQAKPVAKSVAKPAAPAPKVAEPKVAEPTSPAKSGDTFKVKNVGKRQLCLSKGTIKIGETGKATVAEYSQLSAFMEKV